MVIAPTSHRIDTLIGDAWKFNKGDVPGAEVPGFSDVSWASISVPHTWNAIDGQDGPTTTPAYYRGIGWYRRHLMIPGNMMGMKIYLQFDGSAYISDVWVNGKPVGTHKGGYAAFRFDITAAAVVGADNVIAVKVDNAEAVSPANNWIGGTMADVAPLSGDFTFFGGIQRPVHVLATDLLAISPMDFGSPGVYLKAANVSAASADVTATVRLLNGNTSDRMASVDVQIFESGAMTPLQTLTATVNVPANQGADAVVTGKVMNPHLWNGLADPYVYQVAVVVKDGATVTDSIQQPFGVRSYTVNPNTGFSLNGNPYPLRGVCMHQDHKNLGGTFSPKDIDNDFAILKEIGATTVRFAHYQHSDYTYSKADQAGIVTWAENAFVNRIPQTCPAQCQAFQANTQQQLTELIRQNYNHPSIFFWSLGNEVLLRPGPDPLAVMTNIANVGKMEDPTRTIIFAANAGADANPTNWVSQATAFNEYQGWYFGRAGDFAGWADLIHSQHPTVPVGLSEYGAGSNPVNHGLPIVETGTDRTATFQTEEYQAFFHETFWQAIATRPFLLGTWVWNMFDFASDYRNEGNLPGMNTKGIVTYDRAIKKDPFWYYKANWSKDPVIYIASRRFAALPRSSTSIKVYSNQPEVEVTLNGTSLGRKTAPNHIFTWAGVTWAAGANKVDATATSGLGTPDTVTWQN